MIGGAVSASAAAVSFVNDLSASAQAQLNVLREGSATANNAINARFANSASVAANIGTIAAANVPSLAGISNTFVGVSSSLAAPIFLRSVTPGIIFYETDADVDDKVWRIIAAGDTFALQALDDAGTVSRTWLQVRRNGNSITNISLSCSNVYVNGYDVLSPPELNGVAAASYARLDAAQTFAKGAGSTIVAAGTTGTITPNCESGNVFRVGPATGNLTFAAPTNARSGQTIVIHVIQGVGSHTGTWNSIYKFAGSTDPTLSTAASARDVFAFNYDSTSNVWCQAGLNVG